MLALSFLHKEEKNRRMNLFKRFKPGAMNQLQWLLQVVEKNSVLKKFLRLFFKTNPVVLGSKLNQNEKNWIVIIGFICVKVRI